MRPFIAVPALARAARRRGVRITECCAVRTVETHAGAVSAVHTELGRVETPAVLLAGGVWSSAFAGNLGIDLPQLAVRATVARTNPTSGPDIANLSLPDFRVRGRADGGYTITSGDISEHFITRRSFKDLTRFFKLLRLSLGHVQLRPWPPAGYPDGWRTPSRWHAQDTSPFEHMRVLDPAPSERVQS